jgi:hypothetical protein
LRWNFSKLNGCVRNDDDFGLQRPEALLTGRPVSAAKRSPGNAIATCVQMTIQFNIHKIYRNSSITTLDVKLFVTFFLHSCHIQTANILKATFPDGSFLM